MINRVQDLEPGKLYVVVPDLDKEDALGAAKGLWFTGLQAWRTPGDKVTILEIVAKRGDVVMYIGTTHMEVTKGDLLHLKTAGVEPPEDIASCVYYNFLDTSSVLFYVPSTRPQRVLNVLNKLRLTSREDSNRSQ